MLTRLLIGSAAASLLLSAAQAADVETSPQAFDWSGFYLGATAGYAWADADFDVDPNGIWEESPEAVAGIQDVTESHLKPEGFIGGLKLGWNMQIDSWVFGLEADISYVDADDNEEGHDLIPGTGIVGFRNEASLSWLSTLRARTGLAFERTFIYATGGLALADWDVEAVFGLDPNVTARFHESEWRAGWIAGGGIEYALSDSWTVNAEYLYADFGKIDGGSVFEPPVNPGHNQTYEVDLTTQIVRAGIAYRF